MSNTILLLQSSYGGVVRIVASHITNYSPIGDYTNITLSSKESIQVTNTPEQIDEALKEAYYMPKLVQFTKSDG